MAIDITSAVRGLLDRFRAGRLRRGFETPALFARELNRFYHTRLGRWPYNKTGVDLFGADWDTLAIADACRYDIFAAYHDLPGRLESRRSHGSSTTEWLGANFNGDHRDTVYVTANPQFNANRDQFDVRFCDVIDLWSDEHWDDEFQTVRPETVTTAALDAAERYPHKRLLVHYIQPHYPFIGPTGREHFDNDSLRFWGRVRDGSLDVTEGMLRKATRENFELLCPALADLLNGRPGRTVVSADHGQMFGERSFPVPIREYGHPRQTYTDELVHVPWLVHEHGERPTIEADEATETSSTDRDELNDRLAALGYAE